MPIYSSVSEFSFCKKCIDDNEQLPWLLLQKPYLTPVLDRVKQEAMCYENATEVAAPTKESENGFGKLFTNLLTLHSITLSYCLK